MSRSAVSGKPSTSEAVLHRKSHNSSEDCYHDGSIIRRTHPIPMARRKTNTPDALDRACSDNGNSNSSARSIKRFGVPIANELFDYP